MCGFVSVVLRPGEVVNRRELETMTDVLHHRGPDDRGFFIDRNFALGFRRLSILDLSGHGHQPMTDEEDILTIVFNGEIYNYIELRDELETLGYRFRSSGDTEVLLNAYKQWGADCLQRLNGMWAFVIYDRRREIVFGSRDRFGVKPLFMYHDDGRTICASEIKAIRASNLYEPQINWSLASEYLLQNKLSEPGPQMDTLYKSVTEVPAGFAFELGASNPVRFWQYWDSNTAQVNCKRQDAVEEFAQLFEDSVKLRMRSDVPVGVCLSGGLDSTSIICHMAKILGEDRTLPLRAFSYMSAEFDESEQIEATIRQTDAVLHRLDTEPASMWDKLGEILHFHDEPVHSLTVLVSYELYRLARDNGVKVILNGQGADETLAGYPSYFYNYWYSLFWSGRIPTLLRQMNVCIAAHDMDSRAVYGKATSLLLKSPLRRSSSYRQLSNWKQRSALEQDDWFSKDLIDQYPKAPPIYEPQYLDDTLRRSVTQSPLPLYLRVEDRNSMAHSVETRLPFLDYRLVTLALSLPDDLKMRGPWNKHMLREAMSGRIPDCVTRRKDKMGFPVPERDWIAGSLYEPVRDMLSTQTMRERGIYNTGAIIKDLEKHQRRETDLSEEILRVVQFELVCQMLADGLGKSSEKQPISEFA
jgi:asparagine synthase (glutamine-hydrolysing)